MRTRLGTARVAGYRAPRTADAGAWSIPKGLVAGGEESLAAACREFEEETGVRLTGPFLSLGSVRQKASKLVYAWAWRVMPTQHASAEPNADRVAAEFGPLTQVSGGGSGRLVPSPDRTGEAQSSPCGVY